MKRNIKIITIFVVLTILGSIMVSSAGAVDTNGFDYEKEVDRLIGLGIMLGDKEDFNPDSNITRAEFTTMIIRCLGVENIGHSEAYFTDITDDYWAKDEIMTAYHMGIVSGINGRFEPDSAVTYEQAIKMIVSCLGYDTIAQEFGGYPQGYIKVAVQERVLEGVSLKIGQKLSYGSAVILINNILEIPFLINRNFKDGGEFIKSGTGGTQEQTILKDALKLEPYYVQISEIDIKKHMIFVTSLKELNLKEKYDVSEKIDMLSFAEGYATIYVGIDDDIVYYIEMRDDIKVIYDFIEGINDNFETGGVYYPSGIESVYLRNDENEYQVEDIEVFYNDEKIINQPQQLVNCFAKVVIENDMITRMEAYQLNEGGIIYRADPDMIKYTKGEVNENIVLGFSSAKDLTIIIDGVLYSEMRDLKDEMIFDYWANEEEKKYIIVASTRKVQKVLSGASEDTLIFGDDTYDIDQRFGFYKYSNTVDKYKLDEPINYYIGKPVIIYIDDNKCVRYMKINLTQMDETEFLGVVVGTEHEGGSLIKNRKIKIFRLTPPQESTIYNVSEKMDNNSPITYEHAGRVASDLDGRGVFKFTINKLGEIIKIENIEYFHNRISRTSAFPENTEGFALGMYWNKATIFALLNVEGEFTVKFLTFANNISNFRATGNSFDDYKELIITSDYDIKENPIPSLIMLTGGTEFLNRGYSMYFVSKKIGKTADDTYTMTRMSGISLVKTEFPKEEIDNMGVKADCIVRLSSGYLGKYSMKVTKVYYLDDNPPNDKKTDTFSDTATNGFFAADRVLFRDENVMQFEIDGEPTPVYHIRDNLTVYERKKNGELVIAEDFVPSSAENWFKRKFAVDNISVGDKVWFAISDGQFPRAISMIIYEKSGMFPQ